MDPHDARTKLARPSLPSESANTEHLHVDDILEIASLPPPDLLDAGTQLGAYVIGQRIGEGGGGVVYAAQHGVTGRRAAVKVLRAEMLRFPTMLARFRREATAVNRIRHPNIVEVYEVGEVSEGRPYFVMELLEGIDLRKYLEAHGRCSPAEALALLDPVCQAVQAAHEAGFIHRDIKATNVVITETDGQRVIKLLDFGIAKLMYGEGSGGQGLTEPGTVLGTTHSMAPEQIRCELLDQRVDVYAMGVLLFQLLTGRYPFQAADQRRVAFMQLQSPPPRPSDFAKVSPAVDAVVLCCLQKNREERFHSASELLAALRAAVDESVGAERAEEATTRALGAYFEVQLGLGELADEVVEDINNVLESLESELTKLGFTFPLRTTSALLGVRPIDAAGGTEGEEEMILSATINRLCANIERRANRQPGVRLSVSVSVGEAVCRTTARGLEVLGGSLLEIDTWTAPRRLDG